MSSLLGPPGPPCADWPLRAWLSSARATSGARSVRRCISPRIWRTWRFRNGWPPPRPSAVPESMGFVLRDAA
eukprot:10166821-Alexandrium_andersonii.AAC.1